VSTTQLINCVAYTISVSNKKKTIQDWSEFLIQIKPSIQSSMRWEWNGGEKKNWFELIIRTIISSSKKIQIILIHRKNHHHVRSCDFVFLLLKKRHFLSICRMTIFGFKLGKKKVSTLNRGSARATWHNVKITTRTISFLPEIG
jgi:hypothetical protein